MPRRPSTGKFETREQLEHFVWDKWLNTRLSMREIARLAKISSPAVARILDGAPRAVKYMDVDEKDGLLSKGVGERNP